MSKRNRAVVTGMGILAPNGTGLKAVLALVGGGRKRRRPDYTF